MTAVVVVLFSIAGTVLLGATALTAADALASTPPDATESVADLLAWELTRPPAVRAQKRRGSRLSNPMERLRQYPTPVRYSPD